ncbi:MULTISPECIES: helix-turn-helix domain-containing protein [Proteus]|jgi:AraC family transcriptional regulator, mar-sox-rob regulon activator|uniref:Helix-turn-helix domain-containing protein n=9 Tax=Enterobacterales TaxID=91347 RepID=A0A6G6SV89_9GAMM|nr:MULTISPECIES: helix-turn-helix domain-containing protein [Proteus]EEG87454.1 transcriptional regulator, AraC family [Proteus penneri ATCC 35198]KLU19020.1 AraC family transcriptional regulator [Proteus mirabilis]NBN60508.1 helix-turn-helix domain-containing protein [Proteus sp. G2639]ATN00228.1 AraC family transcriptional regulator [Proteus vulgaris]AYY81026.1 AraC family transcriptional regulator [Proteus vulgaris]
MPQDNHLALVCALSKWIEEHLGRVIHLEELAAYSGYSLWHMQKIFKEVTGTSLGKYIRQRRLAGAIHLLRTSERSIFDIALDFGFGSQSHFTYMFRKEYGITPFDFRQNQEIVLETKQPLHLQSPCCD